MPTLPEPPDDLEGCVRLARARGHDEQNAVLAASNCLQHAIHGNPLVVPGLLAGGVLVVGLHDHIGGRGVLQPPPLAKTLPEKLGRREGIHRQGGFHLLTEAGSVAEQETVAVRGEDEGHVQAFGVAQALLHPGADRVAVVLGLDDGQGKVLLPEEHVVRTLPLAALPELAPDDDLAIGEGEFAADLCLQVPPGRLDGRIDELHADIAFAEALLAHSTGKYSELRDLAAVRCGG